jgi:hypothetical protein
MKITIPYRLTGGCVFALLSLGCSKNNSSTSTTGTASVPAIYSKIYGATSITSDGTTITIKSNGTPDHKSVYYPTSNALYQSFSGTTFGGNSFSKNPNSISTKSYTFKIPANPAVTGNHAATPLGPIGVSLNGVPFFNQYAGPNQPLSGEVVSFDQYWGHPAPGGDYHYHVEPPRFPAGRLPGIRAGRRRFRRYQRHAGCLSWPYGYYSRLSRRHLSLPHHQYRSLYQWKRILWNSRYGLSITFYAPASSSPYCIAAAGNPPG